MACVVSNDAQKANIVTALRTYNTERLRILDKISKNQPLDPNDSEGLEPFKYRHLLSETSLNNAILANTNLENGQMCYTQLQHANLYKANCKNTNCKNADMSSASLSEAQFQDANLSGAKLCDTNLFNTDLTGANLYKANLSGALLHNSILTGAVIISANRITHLAYTNCITTFDELSYVIETGKLDFPISDQQHNRYRAIAIEILQYHDKSAYDPSQIGSQETIAGLKMLRNSLNKSLVTMALPALDVKQPTSPPSSLKSFFESTIFDPNIIGQIKELVYKVERKSYSQRLQEERELKSLGISIN